MEQRRPPKRLPREYFEIWSALEEADRVARSRGELARRLRVSTSTLQRILVDGDVPRLTRTASTRVLHSWTRILTRLACFFGKEPRRWVEMVGVPWNETTSGVSGAAQRDLDPAHRARATPAAPAQSASLPAARRVEIGLVERAPFCFPLRGGASFLEEYARRLILAVDPSRQPVFRTFPEAELFRALMHPGTPLAFGIGAVATVAERHRGIAFLPVPGWRLGLAGLRLGPALDSGMLPQWSEVTDPAGKARLVVRDQGPAHRFLAGPCGIAARRLLPVAGPTPAGSTPSNPAPAAVLAAAFLRESAAQTTEPVFVVDDVATCREVRERIESGRKSADRVVEIAPSESAPRSYPLAVAIPAAAVETFRLLRAARDRELFGAAREETAWVYADFLAAAHRRQAFDAAARLETFRQAGRSFRSAFCRSLLVALSEPAPENTALDAPPSGSAERPAPVRLLSPRTVDTAHRLLPAVWRASVDAAVRDLTPRPLAWHCRSCSASLHETHNQGVSDHYCRYCSDEQGRLRPREEVRRILAGWFAHWQGEMPAEEAARRADSYMRAMPAWSEN